MLFICLVPYIHTFLYYILILCSYFHLLFLTLLATRYILQFTKSYDFITICRNIMEIKKTLHSPRRKKTCSINYNQNKYSNMIIFGTKSELFLCLYQVTFFLVSAWAKIFLSYHIQMNILIYKWFCDKKIS